MLVSFGNDVAANTTLARSLADLFGEPAAGATPTPSPGASPGASPGPSPAPVPVPVGDTASLIAQADAAFREGEAALRAGDFAAYGAAQDRLRAALDQLATPQPSPQSSPTG